MSARRSSLAWSLSDNSKTHIVITGSLDGKNVVWKEKVTDEQYNGE